MPDETHICTPATIARLAEWPGTNPGPAGSVSGATTNAGVISSGFSRMSRVACHHDTPVTASISRPMSA